MVRTHLGIDLTGDGKVFARPGVAKKQIDAVTQLNNAGIPSISNILLLHPNSTFDSMEHTLQQVSMLQTGYLVFVKMQAFAGTRLSESLQNEGRLSGNPLQYHYSFDDPRMTRFAHLFTTLRAGGFGHFSIMYRAHELACQLAFAKRLDLPVARQDENDMAHDLDECMTGALYVEETEFLNGGVLVFPRRNRNDNHMEFISDKRVRA
ncbi:MAG: hypothetical protein JXR76_17110 [Deltaproteobacteria bacterium]|nr:hypothetical protein [Deltaproteobacteria bacterium]